MATNESLGCWKDVAAIYSAHSLPFPEGQVVTGKFGDNYMLRPGGDYTVNPDEDNGVNWVFVPTDKVRYGCHYQQQYGGGSGAGIAGQGGGGASGNTMLKTVYDSNNDGVVNKADCAAALCDDSSGVVVNAAVTNRVVSQIQNQCPEYIFQAQAAAVDQAFPTPVQLYHVQLPRIITNEPGFDTSDPDGFTIRWADGWRHFSVKGILWVQIYGANSFVGVGMDFDDSFDPNFPQQAANLSVGLDHDEPPGSGIYGMIPGSFSSFTYFLSEGEEKKISLATNVGPGGGKHIAGTPAALEIKVSCRPGINAVFPPVAVSPVLQFDFLETSGVNFSETINGFTGSTDNGKTVVSKTRGNLQGLLFGPSSGQADTLSVDIPEQYRPSFDLESATDTTDGFSLVYVFELKQDPAQDPATYFGLGVLDNVNGDDNISDSEVVQFFVDATGDGHVKIGPTIFNSGSGPVKQEVTFTIDPATFYDKVHSMIIEFSGQTSGSPGWTIYLDGQSIGTGTELLYQHWSDANVISLMQWYGSVQYMPNSVDTAPPVQVGSGITYAFHVIPKVMTALERGIYENMADSANFFPSPA